MWHSILSNFFIKHICEPDLHDVIRNDLMSRLTDDDRKEQEQFFPNEEILRFRARELEVIDMPGMMCVGRPHSVFDLGFAKLEIPSEDVGSLLELWEKSPPRLMKMPDRKRRQNIYKLKGNRSCLVLKKTTYKQLMGLMRAGLSDADDKARVFYAERALKGLPSPAEALRSAASKTTGVPLGQIPDLGGHKVDSFLPKVVGRA